MINKKTTSDQSKKSPGTSVWPIVLGAALVATPVAQTVGNYIIERSTKISFNDAVTPEPKCVVSFNNGRAVARMFERTQGAKGGYSEMQISDTLHSTTDKTPLTTGLTGIFEAPSGRVMLDGNGAGSYFKQGYALQVKVTGWTKDGTVDVPQGHCSLVGHKKDATTDGSAKLSSTYENRPLAPSEFKLGS